MCANVGDVLERQEIRHALVAVDVALSRGDNACRSQTGVQAITVRRVANRPQQRPRTISTVTQVRERIPGCPDGALPASGHNGRYAGDIAFWQGARPIGPVVCPESGAAGWLAGITAGSIIGFKDRIHTVEREVSVAAAEPGARNVTKAEE